MFYGLTKETCRLSNQRHDIDIQSFDVSLTSMVIGRFRIAPFVLNTTKQVQAIKDGR
jgi:hypothetical protein